MLEGKTDTLLRRRKGPDKKTMGDSGRDYCFSNVQTVITALKQEPEKKEDNKLKQCYNAGRRNHLAPLTTVSSATVHAIRRAK
jgi:hypothetical protein